MNVWIRCLILVSLIPLTACVTAISSGVGAVATGVGSYYDYKTYEKTQPTFVTPPLEDYSEEVRNKAADEMDKLGAPCPRTELVADCSALVTLMNDYATLRKKIKEVKDGD